MWRNWIYVPHSPEYALPWLLGPAVSMVLALVGLPAGKPPEFGISWTSTLAYVVAAIAIAILNGLVLWTHVRAQFLTWRTARRPFLGTYILITAAYLLLFAFVLVETGQARVSFVAPDPHYTTRCILVGICSILPALIVSALWKSEEPGVSNVRLQRAVALSLLRRLHDKKITADDYRALVEVLDALPKTARTARSQLMMDADRNLSTVWATAAYDMFTVLREKTVTDYYKHPKLEELQAVIAAGQNNMEREQ